MPEPLKKSEVNSKTDPSVAKQWDDQTPKSEQVQDFYKFVDSMKIGLLGTYRNGVGPVHRSMAIARRDGPDFLFLGNTHSKKFEDLKDNKEATISFQNSSTQDWGSVTGVATVANAEDPRIKEVWSKGAAAWFGDLGDGVHTGGPEDPRMGLIEIKAKYISYWKSQVSSVGFLKEVVGANLTGGVANTGALRQLTAEDIEKERGQK